MRLPKVLPSDLLTKLPRESEWHSEEWTLDTTSAHKHFFGKSLEEAEMMFGENSMLYQEDVMWMPFIPCCYYLQAYSRYLLSDDSALDPDGASCYIALIDWLGEDARRIPANLSSLIQRTLLRISTLQGFYGADVAIYGSFEERVGKIKLA
ncbi:hypothetical protein [Rariglobus hedericola]|uniref:Uncharacterized protein n=1 Tax=Rariglobus hedericola TaxID=2597822 RepID=A0A556QPP3_9BACT|nr:hypothetical protein [Rariglobus hedericola]TSJ78614.1 hypothetical protein FPL22_04740 [Rariglobus hedericola]